MRSPNRSRAKDDPEPPPPGTGDCNTKYALNVYSIHNLSTGLGSLVDKSSETFHNQIRLSTETVDNSSNLWISGELSTIRPQEDAGYPHFYPQLRGRPFALGKANLSSYTHIHRPYYYYCSNRYMLGSNNKVRREAV